ncbi:hypothetical protein C8Q79DRAFT_1004867 [Trametes meyenii]|nr:hypothetical protein C8Q79DRAFT_1004867 [Trametes meyenii]
MRSPVIAFSIIAAAVSPTLVSGAPASSHFDKALAKTDNLPHDIRPFSGSVERRNVPGPVGDIIKPFESDALGSVASKEATNGKTGNKDVDPVSRTQAMRQAKANEEAPKTSLPSKRASDQYTAGGNAYSGAAADSSGGSVQNEATDGGLTNDDGSNGPGAGGSSFSGFAFGGNGAGHGPGGNAYSGATGNSRGGDVINSAEDGQASDIENTTANNGAAGGFSESGSAEGGNAAEPQALSTGVQKRAGDAGTAGGNAYSGATNDVSGGSVVNAADDDGTVTNDGGNNAGTAGTTFSGDADGGNGNGLGPGGNAYTGASGPARGGNVVNYGGTIDNAANSNVAGTGGTSETGDATGGRA